MNIKEHIDAGHYPVDDKGRALVQTSCGVVTVVSTDKPGGTPILGWTAKGGHIFQAEADTLAILPPPPRKGSARAWVVYPVADDGLPCWGMPKNVYDNPHDPERAYSKPAWAIVEMVHEYEEPWS